MVDEPSEQRTNLDKSLYRIPPDKYGGEYQNHLLEQYKLYVHMAVKISERRQSANSFFLTVNTALIAFLGLVASPDVGGGDAGVAASPPLLWVLVVCTAGVVLCYSWFRLV